MVAGVMAKVAEDQQKFITFDPNKPTPEIIRPAAKAGGSGSGGVQDLGGC